MVQRLYALSGVAFFVLAVGGVVVFGGSTPDSDASAAKVVSYYSAHAGQQQVAAFVLAASVPFLLLFALYLRAVIEDTSPRAAIWGRFMVLGAAIEGAMLLATALIHFALADGIDNGLRVDAARALNVIDGDSWIAWNSALGLMMLGAGALLVTSAARPQWLAWLALVLGVLLFIPFADFFALLATMLVIAGLSIYLYVRPLAVAAPAPSRAT
jgi:hypothetical protein